MRKLLTVLGAFVLFFGFTAGARAGSLVVDFSQVPLGQLVGEQYASLGVHFIPHPGGFGVDGFATTTGNGAPQSGDRYIEFQGNSALGYSGGIAIQWDNPVNVAGFYWGNMTGVYGCWYALRTDAPYSAMVLNSIPGPIGGMFFYGPGWFLDGPGITAPATEPFNFLLVGPPSGGTAYFDSLSWTVIPIPASILLLGTGLLPLLRLRKRFAGHNERC